jgi:ABC-type lipoprotein release transport system permease subunit
MHARHDELRLVFFLRYLMAELRRRKARTLLTALGLGVGVGLVVTVAALSDGLDRAQQEVLEPLTGVGTDISVTRPINLKGGLLGMSAEERKQLEDENPAARVQLNDLGEPGEKFRRIDFISVSQLSFPAAVVTAVRAVDGVQKAAGALTLNSIISSGTVPKLDPDTPPQFQQPPDDLDLDNRSVTGIDLTTSDVAPVTPAQVTTGRYLEGPRDALLNEAYARRAGLEVGERFEIDEKARMQVVGLVRSPLGGQSSDVYIELGRLQKLADREARVNVINVRAENAAAVPGISKGVPTVLPGASVTTAEQLASRIGGSLVDAQKLSDRLGTALAAVALVAALLIASLLTLSGVAKRTRELGTLRAIGWPQRLVVRQVGMESLAIGFLGGLMGAAVGFGGVALVDAIGISLQASVAGTKNPAEGAGGGGQAGEILQSVFGQGNIQAGTEKVVVDAALDSGLLLLAVALAVGVGLLAGAAAALRAARLRPADALRSVE